MKFSMCFEVDGESPGDLYEHLVGVITCRAELVSSSLSNSQSKKPQGRKENCPPRDTRAVIAVEDKYLTGRELAEALSVSRAMVSQWTKEGLPCSYIGKVREARRGSRPRYDMDEVKAWLRSKGNTERVKHG